eukprot:1180536-Prorocentrum_minimum.AAC.3
MEERKIPNLEYRKFVVKRVKLLKYQISKKLTTTSQNDQIKIKTIGSAISRGSQGPALVRKRNGPGFPDPKQILSGGLLFSASRAVRSSGAWRLRARRRRPARAASYCPSRHFATRKRWRACQRATASATCARWVQMTDLSVRK